LKSLHDPVQADKNGAFGQNRVTALKFLGAETVNFEPNQQVSLEVGKDSDLRAVIKEIIQKGESLELVLRGRFDASSLGLRLALLPGQGALFLFCPTEGRFSQAPGECDGQEVGEAFEPSGNGELEKERQDLLGYVRWIKFLEPGAHFSEGSMDHWCEGEQKYGVDNLRVSHEAPGRN